MMRTVFNKQKGFTLVELLLVVALMSIAVGVTGDILVSLIRGYNKSQVINEIEQNANFVSQKLLKELRNATRIEELDPSCGSPPTLASLPCDYNELTLSDSDGNTIVYKVSGGVMTRDPGTNTDENLTINAAPYGVTVTCLAPDCFNLIGVSPQVLEINIRITQSGSPANKVFQGNIDIQDTVVIRDTY